MKIPILVIVLLLLLKNVNGQNIGIGTSTPDQKLDVNGRVRIRHTPGQSAGIWFDGSINTRIGFFGSVDNNTFGLYGSVSGWQLVLNTEDGNVGIGTIEPTAKLDVNGSLRVRGGSPSNGATLVSQDGSGNTSWQRAYAFRASGLTDYDDITRSSNTTTKVNFHYVALYNIGLLYNPQTSTFTVPVKGVYTFSSNMTSYPNVSTTGNVTLELIRTRNNVHTVIAYSNNGTLIIGDLSTFKPHTTIQLHGDFLLEADDQIWIRTNNASSHIFYGGAEKCSFSGHLVTRVF